MNTVNDQTPIKLALCIDTCDFSWQSFERGNEMMAIPQDGELGRYKTRLIDRAICEGDESTLQLLPYNVLINEENKVFVYVRGGGGAEGRLHGKLSVGIGGHVDFAPDESGLPVLLKAEAIREVMEEVGMQWAGPLPEFTHYLMDYTTTVGRVHLGLLSINFVMTEQIGALEDGMVENGEFVSIDFLAEPEQFERLENWSQSVVTYLRRELHSGSNCN